MLKCLILYYIFVYITPTFILAQIAWTPIYVDGNSQVDLWTQASQGCMCPWDPVGSQKDCACCVQDGGCHCGQEAPNRCAQCGLEHHCSSMCNLTIDSQILTTKSGKTFGQIKSPSIEGPSSCWYTLRPGDGQRVELQIYRLVNVGRFNGSGCEQGFLELQNSVSSTTNDVTSGTQICGANERYSPPVVLYSDTSSSAHLVFQINEKTLRSQFLAYFSFTQNNSTQGVGYRPKGGSRVPNTECDWLYQDVECMQNGPGECVLASPGYPGMYPPNRQCRYKITTSSIHTRVKITFKAVLMPHNHCLTDNVAIYEGFSSSSSQLLAKICGNRHGEYEYPGPHLLLEFNSGPQVPPYDYNGFTAVLNFIENSPSTESSMSSPANGFVYTSIDDGIIANVSATGFPPPPDCNIYVSGNNSRSGHFDSRGREWHANCRLVFRGAITDKIHLSLFNYKLKAPACRSVIEIYDGLAEDGIKPMQRLCSPVNKQARDSLGRFNDRQAYISTGNILSIVLRRSFAPVTTEDAEFLDGAYMFHDEQIGGTLQPATLCDVHYYGMSSPSVGTIDNPVDQHMFWNINGPLRCAQKFIPGPNQSVTITIRTLEKMTSGAHCQTQCGDSGCQCVSDGSAHLSQLDHLLLVTDKGQSITCLCGDFQAEWLPVVVRTWSSLFVIYSVAQYTWNSKGYDFSAVYAFVNDAQCGHHVYTSPIGEITAENISSTGYFNNYYYQNCTWILESTVQRQLFIELSSTQNRPCTAWNITVHEYSSKSNHIGELLHTFCPRDKRKTYSLPWKLNTVIVRLRALTRKQPHFRLQWWSQVVRANTRLGSPTPVPNAVSAGSNGALALTTLQALLAILSVASA